MRVPFEYGQDRFAPQSEPAEVTTEVAATLDKRAQFVRTRDDGLRKARARRLSELRSDAAERSDTVADTAWVWLIEQDGAQKAAENGVDIRWSYVARDEQTTKTLVERLSQGDNADGDDPPLAKLATDAGRALRLHLGILAFATLAAVEARWIVNDPEGNRPGRRPRSSAAPSTPDFRRGLRVAHGTRDIADWVKILGISTPGKARTVRVHEALRRLEKLKLLKLTPGRPSIFTVLTEDGKERSWCRPGLDQLDRWFNVPIEFWSNRWYLWLTPAEIATLFAIYHGWQLAPPQAHTEGLGLPESIRRARYAMSNERYNAVHELVEFGLVEMVSPSQRPTPNGPVGSTHHIRPVRMGLRNPARETIIRSLESAELPPRLYILPMLRAREAFADEIRSYLSPNGQSSDS